MELWLTVNGKRTCASAPLDPLTRAVVISLFTWRRAEPDDNADVPMGWWGDTWPAVQNDRYGSRLWLLQRSKLTNQLVQTVRGYIRECLQWMTAWCPVLIWISAAPGLMSWVTVSPSGVVMDQ